VWKFFSDWRTGVPATFLLTMPLWMFNVLPSLDERTELAMITVSAGWLFFSAAGPLMRQWKRSRVATRVKALLQHEAELNAGACAAQRLSWVLQLRRGVHRWTAVRGAAVRCAGDV
jgi:hypothetical protein